jgi:YggT family protein
MLSGLINVAEFLVAMVFGLYAFILLFRFFLQWVKVDFYNPLCQMIMKATNIMILPLRKLIPGFGGLDWSCIVAAYIVFAVQNLLLSVLKGIGINEIIIFAKPIMDIILAVVNMYVYLIIIRAISSWISRGGYNPALVMINQVTEPLMARARKLLPSASGFDFSPIIVLVALFCIQIFLQSFAAQLFS